MDVEESKQDVTVESSGDSLERLLALLNTTEEVTCSRCNNKGVIRFGKTASLGVFQISVQHSTPHQGSCYCGLVSFKSVGIPREFQNSIDSIRNYLQSQQKITD